MSDIVHRLKAQGGKNYGLYAEAASTIEALRGEVDLIKTLGVGAALETVAQKERAQKAEAEAEALRGEVERLRSTFNAGTVEQILKVTQDRAEKAEQEAARLKGALEVPEVWTEAERDGMAAAWREAGKKHGMHETLFAVAAWLLRHRAAKALGETT